MGWLDTRQTLPEDVEPAASTEPVSDETQPQGEGTSQAPEHDDGTGHPAEVPVRQGEVPPEEKPGFRFKDQVEAENGYRNLQSQFTKISQESAKLRKELEEKKHLAGEYERKIAEEKAWKERSGKLKDFSKAAYKKALDSSNRLDPDAPDYAERYAEIMAERDISIRHYEREMGIETETPVPQAAPAERPAYEPSAEEVERVVRMVKDAGIDPESDPVFDYHARRISPDLPLTEQVSIAITETKKYRASLLAQARQEVQQPLSRQGSGKPAEAPAPEVQPIGFSEQMERNRQRRMNMK